MAEQKLATEVCPIIMQLATGEEIQGEIFLQLVGIRGFGEQRLEELLNGEEHFLPVRCKEEVSLVNLRRVASISVPEDKENNTLMKLGVCHRVSVWTTVGNPFEADIYVNLPSNRTRVKDFLNQKQRFLPFFADDRLVYLNFRYIVQVRD
jgi:hypothetical protein